MSQVKAPSPEIIAAIVRSDMCSATRHVRFVPIADIARLFDHLVGAAGPNRFDLFGD
jgi:hypothetical protein